MYIFGLHFKYWKQIKYLKMFGWETFVFQFLGFKPCKKNLKMYSLLAWGDKIQILDLGSGHQDLCSLGP